MFPVKDTNVGSIKLSGRSRAKVLDNFDPDKRGRIRVHHPLLGETVWIPYLTLPGVFSVPEIDDLVYVECDAGFETHPIAWGNLTKGPNGSPELPDAFKRVKPTNRGFYTPEGHLFELDDGQELTRTDRGIRLTTASGNKIHVLEDPTAPMGLITVETLGGAKLTIDGSIDKISAEVTFGDKIEISALDGIQASTPSGTSLSMKNGVVELDGTTGKLKLGAGMVGLGGPAAELLDLVDQLIDQVDQTEIGIQAITVPTAVGPSGPPINSPVFLLIQTNLAAIKALLTSIKGGI